MRRPRSEKLSSVPLSDFPVVFISYDEPWADRIWEKLQEARPDAKRVHGIKGLNACHVAAAEEAGAEWFLTVDADTVLCDSASDVTIPDAYLQPMFRLDWPSRNAVNGIVSGNGSLKLWPRKLVMDMRSHERAPDNRVSLDADVGAIRPGRSRLVPMPGCHSVSDPSRTPFHAFRAGFRETSFLSWLVRRLSGREARNVDDLAQIIAIWCSLGTHAPHGKWMIYGARLGLWAEYAWKNWDIRTTHDYDWIAMFWKRHVLPRIGTGGERCSLSDTHWDADRLGEEITALGRVLENVSDIPMADVGAGVSATMVDGQIFPATRHPAAIDALGRAFQKGSGSPINIPIATELFEVAALLEYPSSITNLARLHQLELAEDPDPDFAESLFRQAMALGCAYAPHHLATLLRQNSEAASTDEIARLVDLSAERGFAPVETTA